MKKKILGGIALFAIAAVAAWNVSLNSQGNELSAVSLANVEALAQEENNSPYCHNGGPGSTSCTISAGISILGNGTTTGCSVSCSSSHYACCSLRCTCVSNS